MLMQSMQNANFNLVLTYRCNFSCDHCLSNCGPNRKETMSLEQARYYIDETVSNIKVHNVGFTGGEVFLCYDLVRELTDYTYQQYGIPGGVVTNCFWANSRETAKQIITELYHSGLRTMVVSCDSFHLQYVPAESIRRVVHQALALGISVTVNTVVTKDGSICKNDIPNLLALSPADMQNNLILKEIGPLRLGRAAQAIRSENYIDTQHEQYFNGSCPFVMVTPTITPNGCMYACCCFGDAEVNSSDLIGYCGNANEEPLGQVYYKMQNNLLFHLLSRHGPYSLLKTVKEKRPDLKVRERYLGTCDVCVELYHNLEVRSALVEYLSGISAVPAPSAAGS